MCVPATLVLHIFFSKLLSMIYPLQTFELFTMFYRFYCTYQSENGPSDIVSYKVNDGICDCCDGSDEWEHTILPVHSIIPGIFVRFLLMLICN